MISFFLCSPPIPGEDSQFDEYFWDGLVQPPTIVKWWLTWPKCFLNLFRDDEDLGWKNKCWNSFFLEGGVPEMTPLFQGNLGWWNIISFGQIYCMGWVISHWKNEKNHSWKLRYSLKSCRAPKGKEHFSSHPLFNMFQLRISSLYQKKNNDIGGAKDGVFSYKLRSIVPGIFPSLLS